MSCAFSCLRPGVSGSGGNTDQVIREMDQEPTNYLLWSNEFVVNMEFRAAAGPIAKDGTLAYVERITQSDLTPSSD